MTVSLAFAAGTIELRGLAEADENVPSACVWDERAACFRAPAMAYASIVLELRRKGLAYEDRARAYEELAHGALVHRTPRPYQTEAIAAFQKARSRGVVVLPTGAGKSHVAVMAIDLLKRSTLVIAPTLDLVRQWYDLLRTTFGIPVGIVGGGEHNVRALTVTTYDSAYLHMENFGHRFGFVIFDEVHHLPTDTYGLAAKLCLAPFRLGLSATPERTDGREAELTQLVGPFVYKRDIIEMSGEFLSDYETVHVDIELSEEERIEYETARATYREFVQSEGINMRDPKGFTRFVQRSAGSIAGRNAMRAYRRQRELAFAASAKLAYVEHLLHLHRNDRAILFTQDNLTAYGIAKRFLLPVITHQTRITERSAILAGFSGDLYSAVATSKVLNEGVDVPDANIAIVVSGSGSVREHVQRLGRVLRKREGKRAILYELVTRNTSESYTSERRREHSAYR